MELGVNIEFQKFEFKSEFCQYFFNDENIYMNLLVMEFFW